MSTLGTILLFLTFGPQATADEPVASALIAAHNRERTERKLSTLVAEPRLTQAAKIHAADMASHATMSHDGSDGSHPADRVKRQKYPYLLTGENVAMAQTSVDEVMKAWMDSPHHRENILGDFSEIGVARAEAGDKTPYWCVVFGRSYPKLDPEKAETELDERLNHIRSDAGKKPLKVDRRLAEAARAIARDSAAKGTIKAEETVDKTKDTTPSPTDRLKESGYQYASISLSNSAGAPTPESLMRSLMDSAEQKASLLGPFTESGFGYAVGEDGHPFWSVILAKPKD